MNRKIAVLTVVFILILSLFSGCTKSESNIDKSTSSYVSNDNVGSDKVPDPGDNAEVIEYE